MPLIYEKYSAAIFGVILRIVKEEKLAEELLQDTFVKVWQKRSYYDSSRGRLFTWMINIARNLSINAINSKSVKEASKIHPLDQNVYHIKSRYRIHVDALDVNDMLKQLDDKYREVVDLAYFQGYTQKEISKKLGMPIGSVKSCVKIALRELKKIYCGKGQMANLL